MNDTPLYRHSFKGTMLREEGESGKRVPEMVLDGVVEDGVNPSTALHRRLEHFVKIVHVQSGVHLNRRRRTTTIRM